MGKWLFMKDVPSVWFGGQPKDTILGGVAPLCKTAKETRYGDITTKEARYG